MRELLPLPARQQRERLSSLPAPPSSSFPITSFSIQTSKKFPFFHVVKCCRYGRTSGRTLATIVFYLKRLDELRLLCCSKQRSVFLCSVKASLCRCVSGTRQRTPSSPAWTWRTSTSSTRSELAASDESSWYVIFTVWSATNQNWLQIQNSLEPLLPNCFKTNFRLGWDQFQIKRCQRKFEISVCLRPVSDLFQIILGPVLS